MHEDRMVTWELLQSLDPVEWDRLLSTSPDLNVFQSHGWGEFKRTCGWNPMRWIARDKDHVVVGMVQILIKIVFPGVLVGWAPGGPVCLLSKDARHVPDDFISALLEAIRTYYKRFSVRFDNYASSDSALADVFRQGLVRPFVKLNTGYSLHLNLQISLDELRARMTAKHRYYVKKSLHERLDWKAGTDDKSVQALLQLHNEMVQTKHLDSLKASSAELMNLCRILGARALIFTGYEKDDPVASCLVLLFGSKAFYWMAATGSRGRKISASYAMVYRLLEYLQAQGISQFDFGGIAPESPAAEGVNHFKRGFGGKLVEHLGEWEWASAWWLRWGMNFAVRVRSDRL